MPREIEVIRLGRIRYGDAMQKMQARFEARQADEAPDTLFLLEHHPVVTLGRAGNETNIKVSKARLAELGVDLYHTGRGGDVTFHGPGQLVGYPVMNLAPDRCDVKRYVCDLEKLMIRMCGLYGVEAHRIDGMIGTWIDGQRKIGAIGVRLSRWITSHGFAFNVNTDLTGFDLIVPCGLSEKDVTSLAKEVGTPLDFDRLMDQVEEDFCETFSK